MSLQRIINACDSLNIDRRRLVSVQYTRSEIARVNETVSRNPWKFTLGISAALKYVPNRDLLEEIDRLDRTKPEIISFSNSATGASKGLSYMFAYQGDNISNVANIQVISFTGNQLVIGNLPNVLASGGAGAYMFRKGDFIQIVGYPYPFTSTTDVLRGNGSTITVTTHRPNFITANVANLNIKVGNDCQFRMFCPNMPTYKLTPGGDNAIISWTSDFQLVEYTGDVL
jgi:hypothetical protein